MYDQLLLSTQVIVLDIRLKRTKPNLRTNEAVLAEAINLAKAIHLNVVYSQTILINKFSAAALISMGHIDKISEIINQHKIELVIVNQTLSPIQQRNLEKAWKCKVIDRTGLILEIFASRAQTSEGKLQVELASLTYQKSRLVKSWTHLERQRGGFGFLGGPGESQLEIDRRLISERIDYIKKELSTVQRTRLLQRRSRQKSEYPLIALVGYTNSGKSTLFNLLTASKVLSKDQLFATLDPTMRAVILPSTRTIILSDTVGFISELPTLLIAAFRATLEEVLEADYIIHVIDSTHEDVIAQKNDVYHVLDELGIHHVVKDNILECYNKIDILSNEKKVEIENENNLENNKIFISALTGEGVHALLSKIDDYLSLDEKIMEYHLEYKDSSQIAWLYKYGQVLNRIDYDDFCYIKVKMSPANIQRFGHKQISKK
ncbi:MAG: GTPase HflX [Alphaproteobacteria bacterium]|nr:GTPase HflX [Alphaproteobacteria bacterium]